MKAATGKYSFEQKNLISGQISQFSYSDDIRQTLAKKGHRDYAPSYIRLVICEKRNQDAIWDAALDVLKARQKAKDEATQSINELISA